MKKLIAALAVIPLILCGCQNKSGSGEQSSDKFTVTVNVDCDDVYGVYCEYSLGGEVGGGAIGSAADNNAMKRGDSLNFDFNSKKLLNSDNLQSVPFQAAFSVMTSNGDKIPISAPTDWAVESDTDYALIGEGTDCQWEWNALDGGEYEFTLESDDGYFLYPAR